MIDRDQPALDREYEALRNGRGFVRLTGWSCLAVGGADRQTFINNFCTNDVKRLSPGESCEAFFTNVKGKIIGHGLIICSAHELQVIATPRQAAGLIEHLDRYVIREDVTLCDTTNDRVIVLVTGQQSGLIPWNLLGNIPSGVKQIDPAGWPELRETLIKECLVECGQPAFETLRIEAGTPLFGIDFDDNNLPQEVGRDREAISFTKGCYLGQETVARIDALGHVNQRLAGIRFEGNEMPQRNTELKERGTDVTAGHVTSAANSPRLRAPLAVAMVRRGHSAIGTRLDSPVGCCEVIELPLRN